MHLLFLLIVIYFLNESLNLQEKYSSPFSVSRRSSSRIWYFLWLNCTRRDAIWVSGTTGLSVCFQYQTEITPIMEKKGNKRLNIHLSNIFMPLWAHLFISVYCYKSISVGLKNTPVGLPLPNWASGEPSATEQPGHRPVSHIIPHTSIIFRTQSSLWKHHSAAASQIHLCASAEPGGNDLVSTDVWLWKPASLPGIFFLRRNFKIFLSPYVSEHKMKMRSPLCGDNFPWVKPIEHYSAVSNLSGKVFERYSRTLDAHV